MKKVEVNKINNILFECMIKLVTQIPFIFQCFERKEDVYDEITKNNVNYINKNLIIYNKYQRKKIDIIQS